MAFGNEEKKYLKKSAVLNSLKDISGLPIIKGPKKTFVVGFYISALSILSISKTLLTRSESPFEYVLTYRFSQDIIEMYFSKIRSRFGWNNNPNALQFKYALRSLLLENKIESPSTAHCVQISEQENNAENVAVDPAVAELLLSSNVWRADVTHYISGYIVKKILQFIDCPECAESLYDNSNISGDHGYSNTPSLLTSKRYGNLVVPSNSVCKVVSCVDKLVRTSLCKWSSFDKQAKLAITSTVLQETKYYTFSSIQNHSMENHILDGNFRDDHITILIKLIVKNYLTIFLHQFGRVYTERLIKIADHQEETN